MMRSAQCCYFHFPVKITVIFPFRKCCAVHGSVWHRPTRQHRLVVRWGRFDAIFVPIAFEMWIWRRMLRSSWTERKTNTWIRENWHTTRTIHRCNSVLAGLPASSIRPLQRVQNAAARLVLNLDHRAHITPALQQLHWLPVVQYTTEYSTRSPHWCTTYTITPLQPTSLT